MELESTSNFLLFFIYLCKNKKLINKIIINRTFNYIVRKPGKGALMSFDYSRTQQEEERLFFPRKDW